MLKATITFSYEAAPGSVGYENCRTLLECATQDQQAIAAGDLELIAMLEFAAQSVQTVITVADDAMA